MDEIIDRKFVFKAVNPCNGHEYTEKDAIVFCAKDAAVPGMLRQYREECLRLEANQMHILSIDKLIQRVDDFQDEVESRVPDTVGECEIARCIKGEGL